MKIKLKPCPNCGKSPKKLEFWRTVNEDNKWYVSCPSCHWCGSKKIFMWRAKLAWNRLAKKSRKKK